MATKVQEAKQNHQAEQASLSVQLCQIKSQIDNLNKNYTMLETRLKEVNVVLNTMNKIEELSAAESEVEEE